MIVSFFPRHSHWLWHCRLHQRGDLPSLQGCSWHRQHRVATRVVKNSFPRNIWEVQKTIIGRATCCDSPIFARGVFNVQSILAPRTSHLVPRNYPRILHSHTAGGAQCGEDSRDDACKNLQECLYAFFLHNVFDLRI